MRNFINKITKWVAVDGLLHFLVCYSIVLTFAPFGICMAIAIAVVASLGKEVVDYFIQKDNNAQQVLHDIICDIMGIIMALVWTYITFN